MSSASSIRQTGIPVPKSRPSSVAVSRGSGSDEGEHVRNRVLTLKVHLDWSKDESRKLYQRIRDLSWQAAYYRNAQSLAMLAERRGWRIVGTEGSRGRDKGTEGAHPRGQGTEGTKREKGTEGAALADPTGISKQARATQKGELSGAAYSAAEQEVRGAFSRDIKKILAGQPIPQWKPTAALSIRGHKVQKESGVKIDKTENGRYIIHLAAQSRHCEGGTWLQLPIAPNTKRDEFQSPLLDQMVNWTIPIAKAMVQVKPHKLLVRLCYAVPAPLPPVGDRIATLGPVSHEGRLLLRTELQTKDYTAKLAEIVKKKDEWDLIRRRVLAQIGWKKGHARSKREKLAQLTTDDWMNNCLHTWTHQIAEWCHTQGCGTIRIENIATGDWPADRFLQLLKYKSEDLGIQILEGADVTDESGARAAKSLVQKQAKDITRRRRAQRELSHQLRVKA